MKIRLLALVLMLSISFAIKAQYVPIPDAAFVSWLNANGYAACMNGNQMDTTCSTIRSENDVYFFPSQNSIVNLDGIQYFDSLKVLEYYGTTAISLPALPRMLQRLVCSNSPIAVFPTLPNTLIYFDCRDDQIVSLPALPNGLKTLQCSSNLLTSLPQLPPVMELLSCANNQIASLPTLPNSLKTLECFNNPITSLPVLPSNLFWLNCVDNQLSSLPAIPQSLKRLSCSNNSIGTFPPLPRSMESIDCGNCGLTYINQLPDSITSQLGINNNPNLMCLPKIGYVGNMLWSNTGITCAPNHNNISSGTLPHFNTLPLCDLFNDNGCDVFWNISGKAFNDADANCVMNNELPQPNLKYQLINNGTLVQQTYTNDNGDFSFDTSGIGNYEIKVDTTNLNVICPLYGSRFVSLTATDSLFYGNDFAMKCKDGFDVGVWTVFGNTAFRPANDNVVIISAGDVSNFFSARCASGVSGTVSISMSGPISYLGTANGAITPSNVAGSVITWNVADFGTIDALNDFKVRVHTDTLAQIGQQVCFTVSVTPTAGDNNPNNNTLTHCFNIVNSYDPNDKTVYPAGNIDTAQEWLTYTVRFQNTGNAEAQHIYIMDTLDTDVDAASFQLLAYSHQPNVQIKENIVRFNFPNINLPDSNTNEPGSHGYVQYKVKLKENLPIGTEVNNTAFIYFDFNPPVVTNTTTNTISEVQDTTIIGVKPVANEMSFNVYPNPANHSLTIVTSQVGNTVAIFNTQGTLVMKLAMNGSAETLNINELAGGVYYVEVSSKQGTVRKKFIKL